MASFGGRTGQQFEAYSTLAALTQVTQRTRLGVIVTCAQYRSVAMLAKQAAGIDVMSDGRLIFALGAGWDEGEFRAYGYPFPSPGERVSVFGETLEAVIELWSQPTVDFTGQHVRLAGASCNPRPVTAAAGVDGYPWATRTADRRQARRRRQLERRARRLPSPDRRAGRCVCRGRQGSGHHRDLGVSACRSQRLRGQPASDPRAARGIARPGRDAVSEDHFIGPVDTVISRVQDFVDSGARHIIALFLDAEHSDASAERFYSEVIPAIHSTVAPRRADHGS